MLGDFASLDVQNTYRGSDAYVRILIILILFMLMKRVLWLGQMNKTLVVS
ncbi:hypothetical protein [Piscirickettsia salmonis]